MNLTDKINPMVAELKPSGIRKFFDLAYGVEGIVSLGIGEPDFVTPWHIRDAGIYSLEKGNTMYSPNRGFPELLKAVSDYAGRRFGFDYTPSEVVITVGGSEAIDLTVRAFVSPGQEVIIPEPCFVCYDPITRLAGGVPVPVPCLAEDNFRLSPERLEAAITPKTKMLIQQRSPRLDNRVSRHARAHNHRLRPFQKPRDDRLAHRLRSCPQRSGVVYKQDTSVCNHVRAYHEPVRRNRGA
jgi:aminotransferase